MVNILMILSLYDVLFNVKNEVNFDYMDIQINIYVENYKKEVKEHKKYIKNNTWKNESKQKIVKKINRYLNSNLKNKGEFIVSYSIKKGVTEKPLTREEIINKYSEYIKEVNTYFYEHQEIVNEIIYRSVIRGRLNGDLIDYFYYGNSAKGLLFSTHNIIELIMNDKNKECESICFNALVYGPCERKVTGAKHHSIKISWPILCHYFYDNYYDA